MTDKPRAHDPHQPENTQAPANQTGEDKGRIKRPQKSGGAKDMPDMPRGSESEHQGGPRTRR